MRGGADAAKDGHALAHGPVEVVVVGDGGDAAEAGVLLRHGVAAISVGARRRRHWTLGDAAVTFVRQFGGFLVLALHTAHYLQGRGELEGGRKWL